ncbi:facilitated trehalose transporter Tret1-like [Leptinotarsa decemlineata]|uniref:facilitated trehalose transporter Tret1-like n=1 Tax=Leptinotarsa decemlineata TaxID=7539 RepID=UPI003D306F43
MSNQNDEGKKDFHENKNVVKWDLEQLKCEKTKDSVFLYTSAISVNVLIFACGSGFGWTSPVVPLLKNNDPEINPLAKPISPLEESWIASLYCLGASIGPLFAGNLADVLGRKRTLLTLAIPKLACLLILSFAADIWLFYVTRLFMGLVVGSVFAVVPMYLAEISETHNKGRVGALMVVFLTSGVLYVFLIGPYLSVKVLTLCCALPVILFLVIVGIFIPESPVFLVRSRSHDKAVEALTKLRNRSQAQVQAEILNISERLELEGNERHGGLSIIFKDKGMRKSLVISVGLLMSQQFSGINAVIAFLDPIFDASGTGIPTNLSTILIGFIQVLATIVTAAIVEKLGRKVLLLISSAGTSISMALLGLYFHLQDGNVTLGEKLFWLPIVSLISFIIVFSFGLSGLPWTVTSEIFPSNIMSIAFSLGSFSCFMSSFLVTLGFPILLERHGMAHCFWFFSVCMALSTCFIYCLIPETKGRTSLELQEILKK